MGMGALLFLAGLVIHVGGRFFAAGRLPGDIVIQKGNVTFFFPLMSSLLLSLLLSGLMWLLRKL